MFCFGLKLHFALEASLFSRLKRERQKDWLCRRKKIMCRNTTAVAIDTSRLLRARVGQRLGGNRREPSPSFLLSFFLSFLRNETKTKQRRKIRRFSPISPKRLFPKQRRLFARGFLRADALSRRSGFAHEQLYPTDYRACIVRTIDTSIVVTFAHRRRIYRPPLLDFVASADQCLRRSSETRSRPFAPRKNITIILVRSRTRPERNSLPLRRYF